MADTVGGISGLTRTHLPTYSIDDAGKYLKIDANGNPIFYTETPGGIVTEAGANAANDVGAATGATTALKLANLTANASETQEGVAELATAAEIVTGTDTGADRTLTPGRLKTALASDGMWLTKRTKMPDGATVETYKSNFSAGVDGWGASGSDTTVSYDSSSSELIISANKSASTQVAAYKTMTIPAGYGVRIIGYRYSGTASAFIRIAYRRTSDSTVVTANEVSIASTNTVATAIIPVEADRLYVYLVVGAAYTTADVFRFKQVFVGSSLSYLTGTLSEEAARIADQLGDSPGVGVAASATITATDVATATKGDTIGGKKYTFVTPIGTTEGNVLKGATKEDDLENEKYAINGDTWAASTAYALAATVVNSGKLYTCITAGVSASSGGPTTTDADITDGTVHWRYDETIFGVRHYCAAKHPLVSASRASAVLTITARNTGELSNAITLNCESGTNHTASGTTLTGGYSDAASKMSTAVANASQGLTAKTSGVQADYELLLDSAAGFVKKKVLKSNLETTTQAAGKRALYNAGAGLNGNHFQFPATQVPSSDPNAMDDYEEGSATLSIRGAATAGTYEIASQTTKYTKKGEEVTLRFDFTLASSITGGGVGTLVFEGLPFSIASGTPVAGAIATNNLTFTGAYLVMIYSSTARLMLRQVVSGGAGTNIDISAVAASARFIGTITYTV